MATLLSTIGQFVGEKFVAFLKVIDQTYAKKNEVNSSETGTTILEKLNKLTTGISFTQQVKTTKGVEATEGFATPGYKMFDSASSLLFTTKNAASSDYLAKMTTSEIEFKKHVVCTAGGGTASTSDMRFKKDIVSLRHVLKKVMTWQIFKYTWGPTDWKTIGLSAQDIAKDFPELVHSLEDENKTLTLEYDKLGGVIALRALQEEVYIRRREIKNLKKRLSQLEKRLP